MLGFDDYSPQQLHFLQLYYLYDQFLYAQEETFLGT